MIVGQSPEVTRIKKLIREISKINENCLIVGALGTGKCKIAEEIHSRSKQKSRPFIVLNCSAVGDTITDTDIFGATHEGDLGVERQIGLLEQAHKGILYLENVDTLPLDIQKRLINIYKEQKFKKEGSSKFTPVKLRMIAASTQETIAKPDSLTPEFYALFDGFIIPVPALAKRKQDIPVLFAHFLEYYCQENEKEMPAVPAELFENLMEYDWPGNVRELKNAVRNLVLMSPEGTLSPEFLPFEYKKHPFESLVGKELPVALGLVEDYLIRKSLQRFAGNQTKAANALNVSEAALRYKMKKHHLSKKAF